MSVSYLRSDVIQSSKSTEFLEVELFGTIGDGITDDRNDMIYAINYCSQRGLKLILNSAKTYLIVMGIVTNTTNAHCLNIPSNTTIQSNDGNQATLKFLPSKTNGNYSLKTNNFIGGVPVPPGQVSAIYIDNSISAKKNINISGVHFTTDLIKWYNEGEFLTTVPVCFYLHNSTVSTDFDDSLKNATNYNITNCKVSNFKRGSISVPGRALVNVTINNVTFENISDKALQLPSENLDIFTEYLQTGLTPNVSEFNFNIGNLFDAGVYLYNVNNELIGSIAYTKEYNDSELGSITNNVTTGGGLVQWNIGTILSTVDHVSVLGVVKTGETAGGGNINGVCLDGFSPAKNLTIENCTFNNSLTDHPDHYIYITRRVEGGVIRNNNFIGPPPTTYQTGGGLHIRGASYSNFEIYNNTFINCKTQPFNFSSYTDFNVHHNSILITKDMCLGPPGATISYGSGNNLTIESNTITNTNKIHSAALAPYAGVQTSCVDVKFINNTFTGLSIIGTVPTKNLLHNNNVYETHKNHKNSFIAFQHNNSNESLDVVFQNNEFIISNPAFSHDLIEGFSGLTWVNNSLPPGMNTFRVGDTLKIKNFTCQDSNFEALQLNCEGTITLVNVACTLSYKNFSVYDDIVKNQSIACSNVTRPSGNPGILSDTSLPFLNSLSYNILATVSGANLDFLDIRPLTNIEGHQYSVTNIGLHAITIRDIVNAVHVNANFNNGGVNKLIAANETIILILNKTQNTWSLAS